MTSAPAPLPMRQPQDRRRKREPFGFVVDGIEYALRPPTFGQVADMQTAENETVAVLAMLEGCCTTPEAYEAIRSLDAQDVNELFDDWMTALGGSPGKSPDSAR